jgi:hypothetical protein
VKALEESPNCGRRIHNRFYLNAYVGAYQKPPESMVQLAMLVLLWEYQPWLGKDVPLVAELQQNMSSFYDDRKSVRMRWLPSEPVEGETSEEDYEGIDFTCYI